MIVQGTVVQDGTVVQGTVVPRVVQGSVVQGTFDVEKTPTDEENCVKDIMGCCFASCCPGVVAYNLCLIKGHPTCPRYVVAPGSAAYVWAPAGWGTPTF